MKKNLVLLGMMAVGKTTVAKIVAKELNLKFIDTDENIKKKNSMTIAEIFKKKGESFFRNEEEKEAIESLRKTNCIISLGGGAFMIKNVRKNVLNSAISFWLDTNPTTLNKRIKKNYKRPLLDRGNNLPKLTELYSKRKDIYKLANHKIKCDGLNKIDVASKIIELYEKE